MQQVLEAAAPFVRSHNGRTGGRDARLRVGHTKVYFQNREPRGKFEPGAYGVLVLCELFGFRLQECLRGFVSIGFERASHKSLHVTRQTFRDVALAFLLFGWVPRFFESRPRMKTTHGKRMRRTSLFDMPLPSYYRDVNES